MCAAPSPSSVLCIDKQLVNFLLDRVSVLREQLRAERRAARRLADCLRHARAGTDTDTIDTCLAEYPHTRQHTHGGVAGDKRDGVVDVLSNGKKGEGKDEVTKV